MKNTNTREVEESLKRRQMIFDTNRDDLLRLWRRAQVLESERCIRLVVVCIDVDDPIWTVLADELMPSHNWQQYRDRGQIPIARGSAGRDGIVEMLRSLEVDMRDVVDAIESSQIAVVVFAGSSASVFSFEEARTP